MIKNTEKRGTKKNFTLYDDHLDMIDALLREKHGFSSESDIVRQALVSLYRALKPPYRTETAMGRKRAKEMDKEQALIDMTEEEFVEKFIPGVVFKSDPHGNKFVLMHQIANFVLAVPLEGIKAWSEDNQDVISFHIDKLKELSVEKALTPYIKGVLSAQCGIVFE